MGLPLYGRTWELENPAVHGIGAPAVATGPDGGEITFKRVVEFNEENNATVVYDEETVSTYSYVGTSWIGYDNERSIRKKVRYAKQYELAGYFFWALGQDKDWIISKQGIKFKFHILKNSTNLCLFILIVTLLYMSTLVHISL